MPRCRWANPSNPLYLKYHDEEWGVPSYDDTYLFEMLLLESFQAGLSWECILNKRESFRESFDNFDYHKIAAYDSQKVNELLQNKNIVRNKLKIKASINNAKIFKSISLEYNGFKNYLLKYFKEYPICEVSKTTSIISDNISSDLKKRGMKFVGSVIIYSYLQAIGLINSHENDCFMKN